MTDPADTPDLKIRVDARARKISLRITAAGETVLTLPHARMRREGLRFVAEKRDWLARHRADVPAPVPFAPGQTIPFRGEPHTLTPAPGAADPICLGEGAIYVAGKPAAWPRLVSQWLKAEARAELCDAVAYHAHALDHDAPPITLRDPKSRWGSCSSRGRVSLSWRLILAPSDVLDYVAAHEVCHLVELNHSPRFWALVKRLCPHYTQAEAWLKSHGRELHRYG